MQVVVFNWEKLSGVEKIRKKQ